MPRRLLSGLLLSPPESRMLAGRLGRGAAPLLAALDELDMAIAPMHGPAAADPATAEGWRRALTLAARRLEAAWIALDEAMVAERGTWQREADWVRRWRRPQWPLWAITGLVLAIAGYLGLVFGGYLPAPAWLQGAMDTWWSAVGS
jgi:hypothetical protein